MTKRLLLLLGASCGLAACTTETPGAGAPAMERAGGRGGASGGGGAAGRDAARPADVAAAGGADAGDAGAGGAVSADAAAGGTTAADAAAVEVGAGGAGAALWPAIDDYGATGPFAILREANTGPNAGYDVFRPAQLGAESRKHPIVSWANGTLFGLADYRKLLEHWASHGFVVIAGHTNSTAGGATHKAGIDWLVAENARTGSAFFDRLATKRIGAAGHSQGGGATIAAGSNAPAPAGIVATLPLMPILSFESDKTVVARQAAPMLNINASMDDRDPRGAVADQIFAGGRDLVQASFIGVHEDAMNAAMHRPTLAWWRFRLMDDAAARALFYPAGTCGLCADPAWKQVRHKGAP